MKVVTESHREDMKQTRRDITLWIAEHGGPVVNLIWLSTLGWAATQLWPLIGLAVWIKIGGIAVLALPAVAGLVLSARLDKDFDRFLIAMLWTSLAVAVCATGG